jgi:flagellin
MRINTNVSALNAQRNMSVNQDAAASSMQKLSSGFRINRAADDAAGLGIANKLRADGRAMTQASRNGEQANSLLQVAEGSTGSIQKMLERMKELATQAGSDSTDDAGRSRINTEFTALREEIGRTVDTTKFQGKKLLDASFGNAVNSSSTAIASGTVFTDVKIGGAKAGSFTLGNTTAGKLTLTDGSTTQEVSASANGKQTVSFSNFGVSVDLSAAYTGSATQASAAGNITVSQGTGGGSFLVSSSGDYTGQDRIDLGQINLTTGSSGLDLDTSVLTGVGSARSALSKIDTAISSVASTLGSIGAAQNRIEYAMDNIKTSIQNFSAAESVIRDVDMAEEMTKFSKNNILAQAAQSMLAQANQSSQGVLSLLRG